MKNRKRIIQLGENPKTVFNVGGLGLMLLKILIFYLDQGKSPLGLNLEKFIDNISSSDSGKTSQFQIAQLLDALNEFKDTLFIFTMPNADTDSRIIIELVNSFVSKNMNAHVFTSLGQLRYLSCVAQVDAVVGNSPSGLTEVPSFNKATVLNDNRR